MLSTADTLICGFSAYTIQWPFCLVLRKEKGIALSNQCSHEGLGFCLK